MTPDVVALLPHLVPWSSARSKAQSLQYTTTNHTVHDNQKSLFTNDSPMKMENNNTISQAVYIEFIAADL